MTERKMSYLEGSAIEDHFEDTGDVLLGTSGTFTVCAMARAFPGFGSDGPGSAAPVGFGLTNQPTLTPEDSGYSFIASFTGFIEVAWGDGAAGKQIFAGGAGLIGGGAEGATTILHARFDQNADTVDLWFNGTFFATQAAAGFVPAAGGTPTIIGSPASDPAIEFDGQVGVSGFAIVDSILSAQEIADHYNACLQNDQMFDTGVWDNLWDVRAGLPNVVDATTQWFDEVAAAFLDRNTTDENFSMRTAAHKPRFA